MSVNGEFQRLVGDAAEILRGAPQPAPVLAGSLEQARATAREDLAAAAEQVLALWEQHAGTLPEPTRRQLAPVEERMLAVVRIILGHQL